ncbi:MAG: acyl carrier protein [Clostridia bacterium]|jgi:acyl carrier protein|nr:acyl carrier protein [Clostridia bacterium]MBP5730314.1 acyl carrier protein [Clostridia bacterium]
MDELLQILDEIHGGVDYENCTTLIDDGILDSFDIISIITEVSSAFDVQIPANEIVPDNFNSAAALWKLIERLEDE